MPHFTKDQISMNVITRGDKDSPVVLWAHGWGQSAQAWDQLCSGPIESMGHHFLVDFPGFGQSEHPPSEWGVPEYTEFLAAFLKQSAEQPVFWVGHSFGCRVGLRLAAHYPELIKGLFLIGGAGLRRKRTLRENILLQTKIYTYKTCKKLLSFGLINEDWVKSKFGSPDYKKAPPAFRPVMVRVSADDLTEIVPAITCPVYLVYGSNDKETPPEIGYRLQSLIDGAQMFELAGQDHYTPLADGRHQVVKLLREFLQKNSL